MENTLKKYIFLLIYWAARPPIQRIPLTGYRQTLEEIWVILSTKKFIFILCTSTKKNTFFAFFSELSIGTTVNKQYLY